jgi:hypothetical protein
VTKKKSTETTNNRPVRAAPASRHRTALGAPCVTVAPVPTSRLRAALGLRRVAPGALCVPVAPTPTSRLRAALGPRRVAPGALCVP